MLKATDFSTYFSLFLANSRGKDKLLSLLQYLFEFCCTCGKHSNIDTLRIAYQSSTYLLLLRLIDGHADLLPSEIEYFISKKGIPSLPFLRLDQRHDENLES